MKRFSILVFAVAVPIAAQAQVNFGGSYGQDFNSLAMTGTNVTWTNNTTLLGWYAVRNPSSGFVDVTAYVANDGSSNAGAYYSYGTSSTDSERAMGTIGSGNAAAGSYMYGVRLVNTTGETITDLRVQYDGEQWRKSGVTAAQVVDFSYGLGATSLTAGTYTDYNALDFSSPINTATAAALNGNLASNKVLFDQTITLSWAAGQELWLRWSDPDHGGSDHGLAIDNVVLTNVSQPVPEPATMAVLGLGAAALIRRRRGTRK